MHHYKNCTKPANVGDPFTCNNCGQTYKLEYDSIHAPYKEEGVLKCTSSTPQLHFNTPYSIHAPYKEEGVLKCNCGVELVRWNLTTEPYLILISDTGTSFIDPGETPEQI